MFTASTCLGNVATALGDINLGFFFIPYGRLTAGNGQVMPAFFTSLIIIIKTSELILLLVSAHFYSVTSTSRLKSVWHIVLCTLNSTGLYNQISCLSFRSYSLGMHDPFPYFVG